MSEAASSTGFFGWTQSPIPGVSISAAGLLALADLSTVAQRTAIAGGSSWLDALLLAPGLHYQQAADALARGTGDRVLSIAEAPANHAPDASVGRQDHVSHLCINNAATVHYLRRIARPGQTITLDVGLVKPRTPLGGRRGYLGERGRMFVQSEAPELGWLSHVLYLTSPVLTVAALAMMIFVRDWWGLAFLLALMVSRVLNIWVIKARTQSDKIAYGTSSKHLETPSSSTSSGYYPSLPQSHNALRRQQQQHRVPPISPSPLQDIVSYIIALGPGRGSVRLRGTSEDLHAITADTWLRDKSHLDSYLEAFAKLIVYLVASLSGNQTQGGSIVMMALLLLTAGLLALSNAHAKNFKMKGRMAAPSVSEFEPCKSDSKSGNEPYREENHMSSEDLHSITPSSMSWPQFRNSSGSDYLKGTSAGGLDGGGPSGRSAVLTSQTPIPVSGISPTDLNAYNHGNNSRNSNSAAANHYNDDASSTAWHASRTPSNGSGNMPPSMAAEDWAERGQLESVAPKSARGKATGTIPYLY